jgi:S1-C subfamily serine protease
MKIVIGYKTDSGAEETRCFEDKDTVTLGRNEENDVVFDTPGGRTVSGRHARITRSGGRVMIEDVDSLNGLYVNGRKVSAAEIGPRSTVRLGERGPELEISVEGLEARAGNKTMPMPSLERRQYGERTVGMMIKRALSQAGIIKPSGTSKSTDYLEALMDRKIRQSGSRLRWIVAGIVALVLAGGVAVGVYVRRNRTVQVVQNFGEAAGSAVAAANRYAIFLITGRSQYSDGREGFCTAFAIGQNVLATNAHCVTTATARYEEITAVMNSAPANRYAVTRMVHHPAYRDGSLSPDVGLIVINGQLSNIATMASKAELAELGPGAPVFLYGFPGRLNKVEAPEATFISGQIGRVTGFDQRLGDFGNNTLLQHSAFSSQGTSGSPIFNANGRVVGINTGGYVEDGQVMPGYNFAMRIDLIDSLIPLLQQ